MYVPIRRGNVAALAVLLAVSGCGGDLLSSANTPEPTSSASADLSAAIEAAVVTDRAAGSPSHRGDRQLLAPG